MELFYEHFITNDGYLVVLEGLLVTVEIAVFGLLIGILFGTLIAIVRVMPKYKLLPKILDIICSIYVGLFRGIPIVVQLLVGYWVILPAIGLSGYALLIAIVMFGLNSAAYVSEIMRSGIQAVDLGQLEAARALGMPYSTSMMKIVIPQSIKNILPTLGNEFIVLIKDTSVVYFIALVDLTRAFQEIGDATYEYVIPYLFLALVYLVLVIGIALLIKLMERRLRKSER